MMSAAATEDMLLIPVTRLRELEAIEAKQKAYMGRLKTLHDSRDTETDRKKSLERYHKNKEEINARRRAAYKAKKAAVVVNSVASITSTE